MKVQRARGLGTHRFVNVTNRKPYMAHILLHFKCESRHEGRSAIENINNVMFFVVFYSIVDSV